MHFVILQLYFYKTNVSIKWRRIYMTFAIPKIPSGLQIFFDVDNSYYFLSDLLMKIMPIIFKSPQNRVILATCYFLYISKSGALSLGYKNCIENVIDSIIRYTDIWERCSRNSYLWQRVLCPASLYRSSTNNV